MCAERPLRIRSISMDLLILQELWTSRVLLYTGLDSSSAGPITTLTHLYRTKALHPFAFGGVTNHDLDSTQSPNTYTLPRAAPITRLNIPVDDAQYHYLLALRPSR